MPLSFYRTSTEVLAIDPSTGELHFDLEVTYEDEHSALFQLEKRGYETIERGYALLGYAVVGSMAGILLASRVKDKGTLPGGHSIYLITENTWVMVQLHQSSGNNTYMSAVESTNEFWRSVQQHTLNNAHYYCETADLTRPFPSSHPPTDPAAEFVWNAWLSMPLKSLGLHSHCPALLQGAAEISPQQSLMPGTPRCAIAMVSRRSRKHPGTRYIARGLNTCATPGNEIEAELIVWTHPEAGSIQHLRWARCVWRRGTVPIWWGVQLQSLNKGLQAEAWVREEDTYLGTLTYFRNLQRHYHAEMSMSGRTGGHPTDASILVPITCVNLLHANPKKASELMLSEHFMAGIRHATALLPSASRNGHASSKKKVEQPPIKVVNFDWHGVMGSLSEEKGVEAFWAFIEGHLKQNGLSAGYMVPARSSKAAADSDMVVTPWGPHWHMVWTQQQSGLLRFNCADSLDRTNAATCFAMVPVLQESLRLLGIPLRTAAQQEPAEQNSLPLPPGWAVVNHSGRPLYIDHVNKTTQWDPPVGNTDEGGDVGIASANASTQLSERGGAGMGTSSPWEFYAGDFSDIEKVREQLAKGPIADYVEMFKIHGDIHAFLYTGSPAMHSHILNLLLPTSSRNAAVTSVGKLQNLRVAVQRRWNNTVSDVSRQQSMELFLGKSLSKYCPELHSLYTDSHTFEELDPQDLPHLMTKGESMAGSELKSMESTGVIQHHDGREVVTGSPIDIEPPVIDDFKDLLL